MIEFTDIHSHFLYGLDDGAQTKAEMQAMLDAAWSDGVRRLFATPHVTPGITPLDPRKLQFRLTEARQYCRQRNYDLALYPGAEILFSPALEYYIRDHRLITLAGTDQVLVEFSPMLPYDRMRAAVRLLQKNGYHPIIAHVERYKALQGGNIYRLKKETRALYQVNCHTVINKNGFFADMRLKKWLREELIDYIATDSHNLGNRKTCMTEAYQMIEKDYGEEYACRLSGSF